MGINKNYTLEGLIDNKPQLLRSLDGINFKVEIGNMKVPEYGIADVDFDSGYTNFELIYVDPLHGEISVYKTPLKSAASQVVQIPAGVAIYSGKYNAVVEIDRKSTTAPWEVGRSWLLWISWYPVKRASIDRNTIGSME